MSLEWGPKCLAVSLVGPAKPLRLSPNAVLHLFLVTVTLTEAKESPIASRAPIRVLKQQKVTEPIFEAVSSGTEKLCTTTIRTPRGLSLRIGFTHGQNLFRATSAIKATVVYIV
jgi:hypothetical protein